VFSAVRHIKRKSDALRSAPLPWLAITELANIERPSLHTNFSPSCNCVSVITQTPLDRHSYYRQSAARWLEISLGSRLFSYANRCVDAWNSLMQWWCCLCTCHLCQFLNVLYVFCWVTVVSPISFSVYFKNVFHVFHSLRDGVSCRYDHPSH